MSLQGVLDYQADLGSYATLWKVYGDTRIPVTEIAKKVHNLFNTLSVWFQLRILQ